MLPAPICIRGQTWAAPTCRSPVASIITGPRLGTSACTGEPPAPFPIPYGIHGPLVSEYDFAAGPEYRGPHNKHAALNFHALVGGSYGVYETELEGVPPGHLGFYSNGVSFLGAFGGSLDLNRSANWALRISPDYMFTNHGSNYQNQFAISVGVLYRFNKKVPKAGEEARSGPVEIASQGKGSPEGCLFLSPTLRQLFPLLSVHETPIPPTNPNFENQHVD